MASLSTRGDGTRSIQFTGPGGKRRTITVGKLPKKAAEELCRKVGHLASLQKAGMPVDPEAAAWVAKLSDTFAAKLAAVGLVPGRQSQALGAFLANYLAGRRAGRVKGGTMTNLVTVANDIRRYFGDAAAVRDISPTRAEDFKSHLLTRTPRLAADTVSRRLTTVRAVFKLAVKLGLTPANPFADVAAPSVVPADRERYVSVADAERIIAGCSPEWVLIFALARYAGLRCPSEVLSLKWEHVDLANGRMTIPSPKTEHRPGGAYRACPVFARLRPHLEHAFELAAGTGAVYVVPGSHRAAADTAEGWKGCNLRTQADKLVRRAGLAPIPKLFHNLRASCQNDLNETFAEALVCQWIGNSRAVARRHYVNARDVDFERAGRVAAGGAAESAVPALQNPLPSGTAANPPEPSRRGETLGKADSGRPVTGSDGSGRNVLLGDTGFEPVTSTV